MQKSVQGGGGEGMGTTRHKGFMDQQASKGSIDFLCGGGGGNDGRKIKEEDRALSPSHTGTSRLSATPPQRKFGGDGGVHPTEYSCMNTAKGQGADGKWERQVLEALQMGTLGRFIFAMLLLYVREKVMREPSSALEGFRLLSETIRQWDAETDEKRLERQFLLKELCIGRRNEHLPSWSGVVTEVRTQQGMPED